ncbi:restriction endonuclease subunit S [Candidatus Nitrotoga fabula]|uniref:Type I restriction-modification system, specificity subunit S n=1 Tax=Candidatus Nitrotoga fabula TaxID=2182327 RepID=A0A916F9I0_9PROT|nr:restriction endonuclease subunit S [Candidatus Nitrotoga fabula]CAE6709434.1 Type I restriction-modification system, specificity subunit S [Candidatus Nitrotoga fabula]
MENDILVFFDCADEIRKTVSPENVSGFKYIGLEHIEQDTLHLNGYGAVEDVSSAKALFSKGDILFGKLRPYFRKVVRAPFDGVCSTDIWIVRAKNGIDQGFLYYWMASQEFVNFSMQGSEGTKMPRAKWEHVGKHVIPFFDESEQRAIAYILSILDDKIELNLQMNKTLESIAQALFKSWFMDFDPVRAKMEGREPEGMDADTAALFPDGFEESELGLVPRGWRVGKVEQLLELVYGKALRASDRTSGFIPVYGSGGIIGYHNKALVEEPSIVIGRKGTVGSLYWEDQPFFPIDTVFYVKSNKPLTYCFYQLQRLGLNEMNTDGAVPGLNRGNVSRLPLIFPLNEIIIKFDEIVLPLRNKISSNLKQVHVLSTLRDTLLPRLISGQLRLPEAEAAMEAVLT